MRTSAVSRMSLTSSTLRALLGIGIHFNFPDPALDVPLLIQARDLKGDITSPSATVRRYGVPAAVD